MKKDITYCFDCKKYSKKIITDYANCYCCPECGKCNVLTLIYDSGDFSIGDTEGLFGLFSDVKDFNKEIRIIRKMIKKSNNKKKKIQSSEDEA